MRGKAHVFYSSLIGRRITPACAGKRLADVAGKLAAEDHPRMCGEKEEEDDHAEKASRALRLTQRLGSPPHVRGKALEPAHELLRDGITPACAGKSNHERRRPCTDLGSPPRMRGKDYRFFFNYRFLRITPAYAGKRQFCPPAGRADKDHPRVCGEKVQTLLYTDVQKGSPPRMRGKVIAFQDCRVVNGITPAYAGKSYRREHGAMQT